MKKGESEGRFGKNMDTIIRDERQVTRVLREKIVSTPGGMMRIEVPDDTSPEIRATGSPVVVKIDGEDYLVLHINH